MSASLAGKVNCFKFNESKFTLVGTQMNFVPLKNTYKLVSLTKPDAIVLPIRPDTLLSHFNCSIKHTDNSNPAFSSRKYFDQIARRGFEVMPSQELRKKVLLELKLNNILFDRVKVKDKVFLKEYE